MLFGEYFQHKICSQYQCFCLIVLFDVYTLAWSWVWGHCLFVGRGKDRAQSGPGAKPTEQWRGPDFLFSCHSDYWLPQKKKKKKIGCAIIDGGEGGRCLFRFSEAFSVSVLKWFCEDIEFTVKACLARRLFSPIIVIVSCLPASK